MFKDYTFYKRKNSNGKNVQYVRFRNPETGERLPGKSTGCTNKPAAEHWVKDYIKSGKLDDLFNSKNNLSFKKYTRTWYIWDECEYLKLKLSKGHKITRTYANTCRTHLENYIEPYFGNTAITDITATNLEEFLKYLQKTESKNKKTLSSSSINSIYQVLANILGEAYRLDLISENPCKKVMKLVVRNAERGRLSKEEIVELFKDINLEKVWDNDLLHYTFNMVAATTGMRQGEILALITKNVKDDYIEVSQSWDRKYGIKSTKTGSTRYIPLFPKTAEYLQKLINLRDLQEDSDALIFHGKIDTKPIDHKAINKHFFQALKAIDIDEDERKAKKITFHSYRHTFNTMMRNEISDSKLQMLTGHKSLRMTDHYTHYNPEDYKDVEVAQKRVFAIA